MVEKRTIKKQNKVSGGQNIMGEKYNPMIMKGKNNRGKRLCEECKVLQRARHVIKIKGRTLCYRCRQKLGDIITINVKRISEPVTREEAEKKIRLVTSSVSKEGYLSCSISLPSCYEGKKVRVIIQEEEK